MEEDLDTVGGQPILDNGCGVKEVIIPVENHSCSTRIGLFIFMCFIKIPRTFTMVAALTMDTLRTKCK